MKSIAGMVWVAPALLAGILLGGWGPRTEIRRLQTELEDLQQQQDRTGCGTLDALSRIMLPSPSPSRSSRDAEPCVSTHVPGLTPAESNAWATASPPATEAGTPRPNRRALRERIETASEVWRLRSEVARVTFIAKARLEAKDAAQFDVLIEAMNLRMLNQIQELADFLATGETLTPEDGARIMHAMTGILTLTYDEMGRTLPEHWRAGAGTDFDLGAFIDPMVAEPLFEVEAALLHPGRGGWRPGRRLPL